MTASVQHLPYWQTLKRIAFTSRMHGAHSQRPLNPQTLERISGLLEDGGSVSLTEKGEATPVPRHAEFRLFAAMNPPTDFGKKELPPSIRTRFTEVHVVAPSLSLIHI